MSYNEPERKAGFTDVEYERHGDAVLMTWRDWVDLRERVKEKRDKMLRYRKLSQLLHDELVYIDALDWMLETMDEILP